MTAITTAARLLRVAADELKNAHTLGGDWGNEHEALDAYNEHMATATTLEHMARQCLQQIEGPTTLAGTTIEQYARMFNAACEALGKISDCLGIDSDIDPGAEPIIAAIEQLRAGKTHPVLDDRWKARMLDGRAIARDEMGLGDHPELPLLDEGMMPRSFFAALGLELTHTSAEEQLDGDVLGAMSEAVNWTDWQPTAPQGKGWKLVSIFDTEDGPVAWWLRELPEAEDGTTTIRNLQAEAEKLEARIARLSRAGAAPAAAAPQAPAAPVDDLAQLVKQLVRALRKAAPGNDLADKALDYLKRQGLQGSPLRTAHEAPPTHVGLLAAAAHIQAKAQAHLDERGSYDPDTGAVEMSESNQEHFNTLDELAEEIRLMADKAAPAPCGKPPQAPATEPVARAIFTNRNKPDVEWLVESVTRGMLLYAAPQAPAAPVAYLDLGAGGYMDLGTDLTEQQLSAMPKGRHMLAIIGTYGIDGYAAAPAAPAVDAWLQPDDMAALQRFHETAEDDESYDIGKEAVARLCAFGCLQSHSFGRYSTTDFGDYLLDTWAGARTLPFTTAAEREARAAQAKEGGA